MVSPDWAAPHPPDLPPVRRREVFAWALFDFANSGYTTVVITAVFNAWFVAGIAGGASWATLAWTAALSLSYALNLLSSPLLGAWADLRAQKRGLLLASTALCVAATAALSLCGPGDVALALALVVVSNFAFGMGENLIAAFLPELEQLAQENPRFRLVATMTDAADWQGERGYIARDMIERHVGDVSKPVFYLAGPPVMVAAMETMLKQASVRPESIRAEMFAGY